MKQVFLIQFLFWSLLGYAANINYSIENKAYKISTLPDFEKNPHFVITHKGSQISRDVVPKIHITFSSVKPDLVPSSVDGYAGVVGWKEKENKVERNIFAMTGEDAVATSVIQKNNQFIFTFNSTSLGQATLTVALPPGNESPSFVMGFNVVKEGWYSLGFMGLTPTAPEKLDFLYQPLVWSWKRFPSQPCITEEAYATTAATFINTAGYTEGIAPAVEMIPYRYALSASWSNKESNKVGGGFAYTNRKGNSLFGLSLRNNEGMAQPMVFAPLLGGDQSLMKAGHQYRFTCKYLLTPGDWLAGSEFLLRNICKYKNERQNGTVTLNQTLENLIEFGMNDRLSGWMEEYKGFDYRFDAPGTVKVVSALHALGVALSTGDYEIYKHRALPMTEYMMSRQKYLFAYDTLQKMQSPSHEMKGPCAEIGELAGLYSMTGGKSSAFAKETDRLFGKPRQLNLNTVTGGASWQDYMARYKITGNADDLKKAKEDALSYIDQNVKIFPSGFTSNAGLKDKQAAFQVDFTTNIYDLFELWEITGDKAFLEASRIGARHLLLWARSNPMAPDSVITVNKGGIVEGIFPGRRQGNSSHEFVAGEVSTRIAEQRIPAWRTSLVGAVPEQHGTYTYGPIMLAHHAAWFLRIAALTNDQLLADAAYNAILGRYANFPGYYFTSLETNVYQMADYPMHDYNDIGYNAIFYNHVWPQIALVMDFLVSDAFYRSKGKVDFPSTYAPGFAYLTSKVYGSKPGKIFGNENIRLWLPSKGLQTSNTAINHLFGIGSDALYLVLMNTSTKVETTLIQLNQDKVAYETDKKYGAIIYDKNGKTTSGEMLNGKISLSIPARSLVTIKIKELVIDVPMFRDLAKTNINHTSTGQNFVRETTGNQFLGIITGMMLNLNHAITDAYIYSDVSANNVRSATIRYKIGDGKWQELTDPVYPYEFSIHLSDPSQKLVFRWASQDKDGKLTESKELELMN
jgi:hypothetical protein